MDASQSRPRLDAEDRRILALGANLCILFVVVLLTAALVLGLAVRLFIAVSGV